MFYNVTDVGQQLQKQLLSNQLLSSEKAYFTIHKLKSSRRRFKNDNWILDSEHCFSTFSDAGPTSRLIKTFGETTGPIVQ